MIPKQRFIVLTALAAIIGLRFVFHALYTPVFEGPDEPFHLARIVNILEGDDASLEGSAPVPQSIVDAIKSYPCCPDLERVFDCAPFAGSMALFNVLDEIQPSNTEAAAYPNYEAHQPPAYYLATAAVLFIAEKSLNSEALDVRWRLLLSRLFSVFLVSIALGLMVVYSRERETFQQALVMPLLVLLLPGAAESLARCANDAGVLCWAACAIVAFDARRYRVLLILMLAGPLIKLTAIPVVVFVVAALWIRGERSYSVMALFVSLAVLPVQYLRGWAFGGTVEFNAASVGINESIPDMLIGITKSAAVFVKTTIWLGGWSFVRPPGPVLVLIVLAFLALMMCYRLKRWKTAEMLPLILALGVAMAAMLVFFISHRMYFGVWGGVGGWYAWGWWPLIVAVRERLVDPRVREELVAIGMLCFLLVVNGFWFKETSSVYSGSLTCSSNSAVPVQQQDTLGATVC